MPFSPGAHRSPRVGLLGLGTVGSAVAERLTSEEWSRDIGRRWGIVPELVVVGVRDPDRPRRFELPRSVPRTADLGSVVERADIDVVVELLGGLEPALTLTRRALQRGLGVVTANKALLAASGAQLEEMARQSRAGLRFEAAVGGGIPLLRPIVEDLSANRITALSGIVNGTTNHILSALAEGGACYEGVLADAQARGYAEADPCADVEGHDAAHKLAILIRLASGSWPEDGLIRRSPPTLRGNAPPGITAVSARHVAGAAGLGYALKLLASATFSEGEPTTARVVPTAVPLASALGATDGVGNLVEVDGDGVGRVSFRGPGAGGSATASAVLADILALGHGAGSTWGFGPSEAAGAPLEDGLGQPMRWLFLASEPPVAYLAHEVKIDAAHNGVFVTQPLALAALRVGLDRAGVREDPVLFPVLEA